MLADVENPTERAAEAVKLLGEEGKNLFSAISDSSDLDRFVGLAAEFGLDTGPEAVRISAEWFGALSTLRVGFEDLQSAVVTEFGDEAVDALQEVAVATVFLSSLVNELSVDVGQLGLATVEVARVFAPALVATGETVVAAFPAIVEGIDDTEGALSRAKDRAAEFRQEFFGDGALTEQQMLQQLGLLVDDLDEELGEAAGSARRFADAQREAAAAARELAAAQQAARSDADQLQSIIDQANADQLSGIAAINAEYQDQLILIASLEDAFGLAGDAEAAVLARRQREVEAFNDEVIADIVEKTNEAQQLITDFTVSNLQSAIGNTVTLLGNEIDRLQGEAEAQEQAAVQAAEASADAARDQADADLEAALAREDLSDDARAAAEQAHEEALARIDTQLAADIAAAETLKEEEQKAALATFEAQQALQTTLAVMDAARAAVALIPAFVFLGPGAPIGAAVAAGAALATQLAIIESQSPPQFPTGLDPDHRLVGIQPGEGIGSRRAMADPVVRDALAAGNEGRRLPEAPREVGVRVDLDPRLQRLRITTDRRLGKRGPRRR